MSHIITSRGKRYDNRYAQAVFIQNGKEIRLGYQLSETQAAVLASQIFNAFGCSVSVHYQLVE